MTLAVSSAQQLGSTADAVPTCQADDSGKQSNVETLVVDSHLGTFEQAILHPTNPPRRHRVLAYAWQCLWRHRGAPGSGIARQNDRTGAELSLTSEDRVMQLKVGAKILNLNVIQLDIAKQLLSRCVTSAD